MHCSIESSLIFLSIQPDRGAACFQMAASCTGTLHQARTAQEPALSMKVLQPCVRVYAETFTACQTLPGDVTLLDYSPCLVPFRFSVLIHTFQIQMGNVLVIGCQYTVPNKQTKRNKQQSIHASDRHSNSHRQRQEARLTPIQQILGILVREAILSLYGLTFFLTNRMYVCTIACAYARAHVVKKCVFIVTWLH